MPAGKTSNAPSFSNADSYFVKLPVVMKKLVITVAWARKIPAKYGFAGLVFSRG